MEDHLTEAQQIEQLKKLWKEYGVAIILGAVIALSVSFGWRFYQSFKTQRAAHAASVYERMMVSLLNNQTKDAMTQADRLSKDFSATPYASLSAFALAQNFVKQNKLPDAVTQLRWVMRHGSSRTFRDVAKIRLARVYIEQQKPEEALALVQPMVRSDFKAIAFMVTGDAFIQLHQQDKAREAYQTSLKLLPESATLRHLVLIKLNDIPAA